MKAADLKLKLIVCYLAVAMIAPPVLAADPRNGEQLARRWCEPCHVAAADQREVAGEAPPLASIATRPGFDARSIAMFPRDSYPILSNSSMSGVEAADVGAYFATMAR